MIRRPERYMLEVQGQKLLVINCGDQEFVRVKDVVKLEKYLLIDDEKEGPKAYIK